jgi:hypothetical protein
MKTITIRLEDQLLSQLAEVDYRPTTAGQIVVELFATIRRTTLIELKGKFSREEIIVLADITNGTMPTWRYLASREMLVAEVEDLRHFENVCDIYGVNFNAMIEKIKGLTAAQVAILQLELYRFWNVGGDGGYDSPSPDLEKLINFLK